MARFYLAGPLFSLQDRLHIERIDAALTEAGHTAFVPHRDGADDSATRGPEDAGADERRKRIFEADMEGLAKCDGVVALLDGADVDAGTAFELGWAWANRRPILGVRSDFRTLGAEGPVSLMVYAALDRYVAADAMEWDRVVKAIVEWADRVKPHGGRLVRDAVPRLVKEKGHEMRFRKAKDDERPVVLKAKVREAAEELTRVERGEEPETLADLLEATEAFIRTRGWDRDTLRAVKEGKWKSRGGYEEGWIVDG